MDSLNAMREAKTAPEPSQASLSRRSLGVDGPPATVPAMVRFEI